MSNRVEELESKVAELQAAVNGLTEELVETKERVRLLEDQVEVDLAAGSRPVGHASPDPDPEPDAQPDTTADTDADADEADEPENPALRESPAQAQSRGATSEQPSDDASFIDADSAEAPAAEPEPSEESTDDAVKSDESQEEDETESAEDDSDIIVA
ncbi:DUF7518 family protein [Halogeometricum limi]|uniref:Chromosome segregation protein SMC n=1 Tax=Halogeometricum limi TaxID=555875 RepID=A0A1I6G569_9EURY|nr:hypothetical protein [Halogeometricum limi]SFR37187.1 hypothetical protein SAMN04488124_0870 [Halogeometricum limi]